MRPTFYPPTAPPKQQVRPTPTPIQRQPQNEPPLFPDSAERALKSISNYVTSNIDPKFRRSKETELQQKLDTELFGLSSDFRSFWQPVQRLKLFNIICNFYMTLPSGKDAAKRYEYFDLMFCGREGTGPAHEYRMNILSNLCSMAIQLPCYSLFDDVAIWFMKIKSNVYAKRIVTEMVEDFILASDELDLCGNLYPLRSNAFEFSCFFIVYSVTEENLCSSLISVIGMWITEEPSEVFSFIAKNPTLCAHFKNECIKPMIAYDVKRSLDDDSHDRFHCAVTYLLLQWRKVNARSGELVRELQLDDFFDNLIPESDNLAEFQRIHLVQNIQNALKLGHYNEISLNQCIQKAEKCSILKNQISNLV